jgi:hypothetical protein
MPLRLNLKLKHPHTKDLTTFTVDFPDTLSDCQALWDGEGALNQTTYHLVIAGARMQLVEHIRHLMTERTTGRGRKRKTHLALSPEEIQQQINHWKPEAHKRSKASVRKLIETIAALPQEEKGALLYAIRES